MDTYVPNFKKFSHRFFSVKQSEIFNFTMGEYDPVNCIGWQFVPKYASEWEFIPEIHEFYSHPMYIHHFTCAHEVLTQAYLNANSTIYGNMVDGLVPLSEALALADIWVRNEEAFDIAQEGVHSVEPIIDTSQRLISICRDSLELLAYYPENLKYLPIVIRTILHSWLENKKKDFIDRDLRKNYYISLMYEIISAGLIATSFFDANSFYRHVIHWSEAIQGAIHGEDWSNEQSPLTNEEWARVKDEKSWRTHEFIMKRVLDYEKLIFMLSNFQRIMKDELSALAISSILASVLHCHRKWILTIKTTIQSGSFNISAIRKNLFNFQEVEYHYYQPKKSLTLDDLQNDFISPFTRVMVLSVQEYKDLIHRNDDSVVYTKIYNQLASILINHLADELTSLEVLNCTQGVLKIHNKYFFGTDYYKKPREFMINSISLADELISEFDTRAIVHKVGEAIGSVDSAYLAQELPDISHIFERATNEISNLSDIQRYRLFSSLVV